MTVNNDMIPQDLHIHTTFSKLDSAIVEEQTIELIAAVRHAEIIGISDHFEHFDEHFEEYAEKVRSFGFHVGTEVDGSQYVADAAALNFEYYIYHCRDEKTEYRGLEFLLNKGKPVIIPHPMMMGTNLDKIPRECYVELNNRYIWRFDWRKKLRPYVNRFRFVLGSDAHQPNWLNQNIARYVARELGIEETILFKD
jgi:histidinol phosphatase-like PHP family hydrolase